MIFFDIDDTLFDYKTSQDIAASKFCDMFSDRLIPEKSDFVKVWDTVAREHMKRYLLGELTFQEQRRERIKAVIHGIKSDKEADLLFSEYYSFYQNSWQLFPDCIEALDILRSKKLGIITNGDLNQQKSKLKKLRIDHYFSFVVTPADVGEAKPSPKIFEYANKLAGVSADECWYVGDDYENDYLASKQLNWNSIWLNRRVSNNNLEGMYSSLLEFAKSIS